MSLISYQDVRPWARSIKQRTLAREMPPWFVDKNIGIQHFKDDPSLSDDEIALIGHWVDAGAPRGNPADMPPPRQWPAGKWTIGEPDLVVESPVAVVEAVAADWFGGIGPAVADRVGHGPLREGGRGEGSAARRRRPGDRAGGGVLQTTRQGTAGGLR